ncbi:protein turtle homolog A-like isoform X2 [Hetaerina americana]|uniref:protein turtle homolog A-like isoform X2 n=1 Tax=Hetaerina americana TaxID=62018 RepID=UPI003A7F3D41
MPRPPSPPPSSFPAPSAAVPRLFLPNLALLIVLLLLASRHRPVAANEPEDDDMETGAWDAEDPVSSIAVEAVVGRSVALPCDIEPAEKDDRVYMVLWFREAAGKPMYSFDVRGRPLGKARLWPDEVALGPRAYFVTISRPAQLNLDSVVEEDEGSYRCRVDFHNSPTRNSLVNLTVIVPPREVKVIGPTGEEVSGSVLGPLSEGDDVLLECHVFGGKPPPTVSWFVGDKLVDGLTEERRTGLAVNRLEVRDVRRRHLNATLRCQASNTKLALPVERSLRLDLLLKPLSVRLVTKPRLLRADQQYDIICETFGSRPRPMFEWWQDAVKIKPSKWKETGNETLAVSTLSLTPGPEDDRQQLKCLSYNPAIQSSTIEDSFVLNVLYPPQVSLMLGSSLRPDDIKEGDDVYFECHVKANPREYKITWMHESRLLVQNTSAGVITSGQSLVLQGVKRHNGGNYRCLATNTEGESSSEQVRLRVQFAPVCASGPPDSSQSLMGPGMPIVVVGASLEEKLNVKCEVAADPSDVAFVWQFSNSGEGFEVPSGRHASNGTVSVLAYTPRTDHDYGTLSCLGANSIGRQAAPCLFQVVPAGRPAPLSNCTVGNRSADWAEVECAPGFDGGLPQAFLLEAYDARSTRLRLNATRHDAPLFRLTDLTPGSSLRLVLYAANAKGRSEATILEDVSLWDAEKRTVETAGPNALGALTFLALLLGALAALFTVALVAMIVVRRRQLIGLETATPNGTARPMMRLCCPAPLLDFIGRDCFSRNRRRGTGDGAGDGDLDDAGGTKVPLVSSGGDSKGDGGTTIDVSRDQYVVSYVIKEQSALKNGGPNSRIPGDGCQPDILAEKAHGTVSAKRPEFLFHKKNDEHMPSNFPPPQWECTSESRWLPPLLSPTSPRAAPPVVLRVRTSPSPPLLLDSDVPSSPKITSFSKTYDPVSIQGTGATETDRFHDILPVSESKKTPEYELSGNIIEEKLRSREIPESCV